MNYFRTCIQSAFDNAAFGGSAAAPLKKYDYKKMAEIEKDKQSLQQLKLKLKQSLHKDASVLETKIKNLKMKINKKMAPVSCLQNPMLEDILKIRGIHGGIYKL